MKPFIQGRGMSRGAGCRRPVGLLFALALLLASCAPLRTSTPHPAADGAPDQAAGSAGATALPGDPAIEGQVAGETPGVDEGAPAAPESDEPRSPPVSPEDLLLQRVDERYLQGVEALERDDPETARGFFDEAVELFLRDPERLWDDARLAADFEDLLEDIHRVSMRARTARPNAPDHVDEDVKEITAFLTPEQAAADKAKVEEMSGAVVFDLPVEVNNRVVAFIDAFSGSRKKLFEPGMVRSGGYLDMFRRIFREEGLPQDLAYMAHIESAFKVRAYSRARAKGMFQFISSTGRMYGLRSDWWVDMRADPELAAHAAARYLKDLHEVYGDWYLALAEYNGGTRIRSAWKRSGRKADFWKLASGRSLRSETRNYVPQILAAIVLHKSPEKYGFTTERAPRVEYETVELDVSLDLRVAARLASATLEDMVRLNPGLRRLATPPDYPKFPLRVPVGRADSFLVELARLPEEERLPWYRHHVRRGETLSTIAARYGTSVRAVQTANNLRNPHRISVGMNLMIPGSAVRVAALDVPAGAEAADGSKLTHRVRRGDTLYSIARRYRTDIKSLTAWNGISDPRLLRAGQRLVVYPGTRARDTAQVAGKLTARAGGAGRERERFTHKVRRGDTLYAIARRYGVSVRALQGWNGMRGRSTIHPGTRLTLYR